MYLCCAATYKSISIILIPKTIKYYMDFFRLLADLGFPIAGAVAAGYFVFLTLKFILAGVISGIKSIESIIDRLNSRVTAMNTEVQKLDIKISYALGLHPDYDRIGRSDKEDQRDD